MTYTHLTSETAGHTLAQFYNILYVPAFPDINERESLENMQKYLHLKEQGWYGLNNYHILLGYDDATGELAAACVSDYFHLPNTGVIEFLLVAPHTRGKGFGRAMLEEMTRVYHEDARRAGRAAADYVMGEMNDPFLTDPADDNLDPFERAKIWGGWGFCALDFPYVQPPLDTDKQAVDNLLLMARPLMDALETTAPAETVRQVVFDYLKWAMRFDDPEENAEYQAMTRFLNERAEVGLIPLQAYAGEAPDRPLSMLAVRGTAELEQILPVYRANFGMKEELAIDEGEFARLVGAPAEAWFRYHLWGLRAQEAGPIEGMASFFVFEWGGFGGYIALDGSLRGTRRLPLLLARMERQMLRDFPASTGWFIECDPPGVENRIFEKAGFYPLPIDYRQPDLDAREGSTGVDHLRRLNLLYRPFGRMYAHQPPTAAEMVRAVSDIFRAVYGIAEPEKTLAFQHLKSVL